MDVKKTDIKRFITSSDIVFVIPVYQRNYDWKKENCTQLYMDIKTLIGMDKTHFIGTVCYKMDGRYQSVIIDGQQRITSVMLLLKALYDVSDDERLKDKIKNQFLTNPYADGDLKLKLKPIKKDEEVFKKVMNASDAVDEDYFTKEELNSNIYRNYKYFYELITSDIRSGINGQDIEDAVERLEVVEICLTEENPQVIFESLNSTGLGLTNTDLLRNYLLMSMDYKDQEYLYQNYWMQIENLLDSENMELFMVHYLIMKRKSNDISENGKSAKITARNLYYAFKKQFPQIGKGNAKEEVEECFKDMYRYARFYKHFIYDDSINVRNLQPVDKKLYELFFLLAEKNAAILVMYLFDKFDRELIDQDTFIKTIDICISFSFRSKVCNRGGFSPQFAALSVQKLDPQPIDDKFLSRFWSAMTSGRGRYAFPTNSEFKIALVNGNTYQSLRSAGSKYLLYSIEKNMPHSKELPEYKNGTVEHVMPQTLSDSWKKYIAKHGGIEKYEKYTHSLGNLTLTNYNSSLSNKEFDIKKEEYKQSNYAFTKELADVSEWTSEVIVSRGERMADIATQIWIIDEDYDQNPGTEIGVVYDLNADFAAFFGTKPAVVSILGEEHSVTNWSDIVSLVADKFYMLAPDTFRGLINCNDFPGKKKVIDLDDSNMPAAHKIDDNLYISTKYDVVNMLNIVKTIVCYFDKHDDTDFINDVWFTLRKK
ncbi:MAG: DUF262 domain-containing protein [Eubacterium sp.]|nr:DUF262 domain-containing protein [Eubacterium sp.]